MFFRSYTHATQSTKTFQTGSKTRFVYFAPADIQVARVDRQCIVYFCEALQRLQVEVELVTMGIKIMREELKAEDPLELYRIEEQFPVKTVSTRVHQESPPYWIGLNRLFAHVSQAIRWTRDSKNGNARLVFYIKNYASALSFLFLRMLSSCKPLVVFEAHIVPQNIFQRWVLRWVDGIVANSFALADDLISQYSVEARKIIGTHQGVNLRLINTLRVSKREARERVGLPQDKRLIICTGKVYCGYKEVEYLLEAANALPEGVEMIIVGGRGDHVERLRSEARWAGINRVRFTGFVPPSEVQYYQFAADILLLYYPGNMPLNKYRSPGKLFEYMASGRPIIAADLPILKEVLGEKPSAIMVPPDSPAQLAKAIMGLLADNHRAEALAASSLERVAQFAWEERAKTIMTFIEKLN